MRYWTEVSVPKFRPPKYSAVNLLEFAEKYRFPNPKSEEGSVVAIGGDLHPHRLISAYLQGIFPWYSKGEPIMWWSPDPRCVLLPENIKISKSMKQLFKKQAYKVSFDQNFPEVIKNCAEIRDENRTDTWLNPDMIRSYNTLHEMGLAHSVEVWDNTGKLVGGLYGLSVGRMFFGESMFHKASNASKYGFIALVQNLIKRDFQLIDCQIYNTHLASLGATLMDKNEFLSLLSENNREQTLLKKWTDWEFQKLEIS